MSAKNNNNPKRTKRRTTIKRSAVTYLKVGAGFDLQARLDRDGTSVRKKSFERAPLRGSWEGSCVLLL